MFDTDLEVLTTRDLLERAAGCRAIANRSDADLLACAQIYADRFHPSVCGPRPSRRPCDGRERAVVLGGDDCPEIAEFAIAEFAVVIGVSPGVGRDLIADALALRHRFPRTWARILAGEATPWKARQIVRACTKLDHPAAEYVDRQVAALVDSISPYRLDKIVQAAKKHADPQRATDEAAEAADERGVFVGRGDQHGNKTIYIKAAAAAVDRHDATISDIAEALKILGDTRPVQHRRAHAVEILADPRFTQELLTQAHNTPQPPPPTTANAKPTPPTNPTQSTEPNKPTQSSGSCECAKSTEPKGSSGSTESTESTESKEFTASSESSESGGSTESTESKESTASNKSGESSGSTESSESGGSTESKESTASNKSGESSGSTESSESGGSKESIESKESTESADSCECAKSTESTESAVPKEPTESTDSTAELVAGPGVAAFTRSRDIADVLEPTGPPDDPWLEAAAPLDPEPVADPYDTRTSTPDLHPHTHPHPEPAQDPPMDAAALKLLNARLSQIKHDAHTNPPPSSPGAEPSPRRKAHLRPGKTEVVVHLTDHTLATGAGVLRAEAIGPLLAAQLTELVGHGPYTVTPVIDLNDAISVNAYEIPTRIRERVKLTHPVELFPYGTRETTNTIDLDHIQPYDPHGPTGQTSTTNLAPLGRFGHRVKTHASGWTVRRIDYKTLEWRTPHGFTFQVDPTGTHRVPSDPRQTRT